MMMVKRFGLTVKCFLGMMITIIKVNYPSLSDLVRAKITLSHPLFPSIKNSLVSAHGNTDYYTVTNS